MNQPLTPEQMAEQLRMANEARAIAAQYSGGQSPMPAGPPEANMSVAPVPAGPPPPPAPPPKEGLVTRGMKDAAITAGSTLLGPIGPALAGQYIQSKNNPVINNAPPNVPPPDPASPAGPPAPPPQDDGMGDGALIAGPSQGGGMVSPAGMYPQSMTTQAHMGRAVPHEAQSAFGASTELALQGAGVTRNADRQLYEHTRDLQALRMKATEDAATQHAAVQAERDQEVQRRMGEIEALNNEASAKIDPEKYWHDRGAFAKVIGAFAIGMGAFAARMRGGPNAALQIIESGINREIDAQKANISNARGGAQQQERLLNLHLSRFGELDRAIDATKLGLYDNVLSQMEAYKADHGAQLSDANYLNLQSSILEKRGEVVNKMALQTTDDVNKAYTEAWHNAQYAGGGAGSGALLGKDNEPTDTITIPSFSKSGGPKRVAVKNPTVASELHKVAYITGEIHRINRQAAKLIGEFGDTPATDIMKRREITNNLNALAEEKSALGSVKVQQGVLKEAEYWRALTNTVGFGGNTVVLQASPAERARVQRFLRSQDVQAYRQLTGAVQSAGGSEVQHQFVRNPKTGALQKVQLETGKLFTPDPIPPEGEKIP